MARKLRLETVVNKNKRKADCAPRHHKKFRQEEDPPTSESEPESTILSSQTSTIKEDTSDDGSSQVDSSDSSSEQSVSASSEDDISASSDEDHDEEELSTDSSDTDHEHVSEADGESESSSVDDNASVSATDESDRGDDATLEQLSEAPKKVSPKKAGKKVKEKLPKKDNKAMASRSSNLKETPMHESGGLTVFVGNLPYELDEKRLQEVFKSCGKIVNIRLVMDKKSGRPRGIAYIDFSSKRDYENALQMHGHEIDGRAIRVDAASSTREFLNKPRSDPSPILFVGNLSYHTTEKTLESVFGRFGEIMSVRIPTSYDRKPKGYAYVQYKSAKDAKAAMLKPRFELDGRMIRLDYDSNFNHRG